jgi:hypothetical protein
MSESEDYVAYHGFAFLKGCSDTHKGGLQVQIILDHEEDYKAFKEFRKHRKGKAGTGLYNCLTRSEMEVEWYGPVQLKFLRWSISSATGAVVTFEMDGKEEWQKMRDAPAQDAGYELAQLQKMEFMLVELDQEGKPVNVEQRAKLEAMARKRKWPKGGPQSKRAARLCQDREFQLWVESLTGGGYVGSPDLVAVWMREECGLDTRAQLDHDPAALQRFEDRMMRPFLRSAMDNSAQHALQ